MPNALELVQGRCQFVFYQATISALITILSSMDFAVVRTGQDEGTSSLGGAVSTPRAGAGLRNERILAGVPRP